MEDERALDSATATVQETADMARDYIASPPPRLFPNMTAPADEFPFADERALRVAHRTDVYVRVIVNGHPLPQLLAVMEASQRTAVVAFPASYLRADSTNVIELHSQDEAAFIVIHVICHFRQES